MKTSPSFLLPLILGGSLAAQVQWTQVNPTRIPPPRSDYAFTPMLGGKALLFGGLNPTQGLENDTWLFDGTTWKPVKTQTSPPRLEAASMAYDILRKRAVLFSGWDGGKYAKETWEFDGKNWIKMNPAVQPPPRDWAAMAYDIHTRRVILFGGHDWHRSVSQKGPYGDTWAWDGKNWTQLKPKTVPAPRQAHKMVVDPRSGIIYMLGGKQEMWMWIVNDWKQLKPKHIPATTWSPLVGFDELRNRIVFYGGVSGGKVLDETWEWNGNDWVKRLTKGGPNVAYAALFYVPALKKLVVFGGGAGGKKISPTNQSMGYGPLFPAAYTTYGAGCAGSGGVPALSGTPPWIGEGFQVDLYNLPSTGAAVLFTGFSKTRTRVGGIPLPFDLSPLGAKGCKVLADPFLGQVLTIGQGTAQARIPVPASPAILGFSLFNQAFVADAKANTLGVTTTNGGEGKIGSK